MQRRLLPLSIGRYTVEVMSGHLKIVAPNDLVSSVLGTQEKNEPMPSRSCLIETKRWPCCERYAELDSSKAPGLRTGRVARLQSMRPLRRPGGIREDPASIAATRPAFRLPDYLLAGAALLCAGSSSHAIDEGMVIMKRSLQ